VFGAPGVPTFVVASCDQSATVLVSVLPRRLKWPFVPADVAMLTSVKAQPERFGGVAGGGSTERRR
jgi:hypothetical protein